MRGLMVAGAALGVLLIFTTFSMCSHWLFAPVGQDAYFEGFWILFFFWGIVVGGAGAVTLGAMVGAIGALARAAEQDTGYAGRGPTGRWAVGSAWRRPARTPRLAPAAGAKRSTSRCNRTRRSVSGGPSAHSRARRRKARAAACPRRWILTLRLARRRWLAWLDGFRAPSRRRRHLRRTTSGNDAGANSIGSSRSSHWCAMAARVAREREVASAAPRLPGRQTSRH